jgi:hypothetical protein
LPALPPLPWTASSTIRQGVVSDFRDRILERHFLKFLGVKSSLFRLEFTTLIFPFYKMLFMNRLEFSCFANFL